MKDTEENDLLHCINSKGHVFNNWVRWLLHWEIKYSRSVCLGSGGDWKLTLVTDFLGEILCMHRSYKTGFEGLDEWVYTV